MGVPAILIIGIHIIERELDFTVSRAGDEPRCRASVAVHGQRPTRAVDPESPGPKLAVIGQPPLEPDIGGSDILDEYPTFHFNCGQADTFAWPVAVSGREAPTVDAYHRPVEDRKQNVEDVDALLPKVHVGD